MSATQAKMLEQMCQELLSAAEVKAICKHRGLPGQAASSRSLLESVFLSDTGVAEAIAGLDAAEIALLHLLRAWGRPVDVTFFRQLDPPRSYGTFTQRYQGVFAKVKERLIRRGILILGQARPTERETTNMARWRFALPVQFERQLPPLVASAQPLEGDGDFRSEVVRAKLREAVGGKKPAEAADEKLELVDGELRFQGRPFSAERLRQWQKDRWLAETTPKKDRDDDSRYTLAPAQAAARVLAALEAGAWGDAQGLTAPLAAFCGFEVDSHSVCESGWRWGCLAKQQVDGKTWYRLPPPDADAPPGDYLTLPNDKGVVVDLETVPLESLEHLVTVSDQQAAPGSRPALLLTPNLVKLGRAGDAVAALPLTEWLVKHATAFREAFQTMRRRRGKTIVHENVAVARVSDLALKVGLEKALGDRVVPLGEEWLAFPRAALPEVSRIVVKLGHVVKEESNRGS